MEPNKKEENDKALIRLHNAISTFTHHFGGAAVLITTPEIKPWPKQSDGHYFMVIKCVGKKPVMPE